MTVTHWMILILALLALACRKRVMAVLRWHPVVLIGNAAVIASLAGSYFFMRWIFELYAWWGLGGILLAGLFIHLWHRWKYGCWLGD